MCESTQGHNHRSLLSIHNHQLWLPYISGFQNSYKLRTTQCSAAQRRWHYHDTNQSTLPSLRTLDWAWWFWCVLEPVRLAYGDRRNSGRQRAGNTAAREHFQEAPGLGGRGGREDGKRALGAGAQRSETSCSTKRTKAPGQTRHVPARDAFLAPPASRRSSRSSRSSRSCLYIRSDQARSRPPRLLR